MIHICDVPRYHAISEEELRQMREKHVLLNASKAYVAQTNKGMFYANLQPVYALNFVNDIFMRDVEDYYHYYHLVHDKFTDEVIDGLHLIFVELPKFKAQTFSERKMQVLWLRFLTEIDENTREAPAELLANAEVNEALEIVERAAFTDEEMFFYDKFWDRVSTQRTLEYDWKMKMEKAEAKTKEAEAKAEEAEAKKKEAEAKQKEAEEKLVNTARYLKAMSLSNEQIAKATGLTPAEIESLE